MPIIAQGQLSTSDAIALTLQPRRHSRGEGAVISTDAIESMVSINNSPDSLLPQSSQRPQIEVNKGFWHKFKNFFLADRSGVSVEETELGKILAEGQTLRQDINNVAEQLRLRAEPQEPAFSLKTKTAWFIGTVLVLTGSGIGLYRWRNPTTHHDSHVSKNDTIKKPLCPTENKPANATLQPAKCRNNQCYQHFRRATDDEPRQKDKRRVAEPMPGNLLRNELKKRETLLSPLSAISGSIDTEMNSYQDNIQTIQRWRNRLIGYVHAHIDVSEAIDNKYLAQKILSLITQHFLHESKIANIYLYGTGLYGERAGDSMSADVQRQLVGDLLARLLYGQSLEDYLVGFFSMNRYISIKDFRKRVIENNFPFAEHDSLAEIKVFHDRYLIPRMPILALELSHYSNILVGSVTWFLIYLCADSEWLDAIKYREVDAVMHGIDVLNYFIGGNLTQGSKNKIHMGLKFSGLYFNNDALPHTLPDFQALWNELREALIKRVSLSSDIVVKLKTINKSIKDIGEQPWISRHEYADYILKKFCRKEDSSLFFIRKGRKVDITKNEFIESVDEQAWCIIFKNKKILRIKIPTIKYPYEKLSNNAFSLITLTSRILIGNALIRSDYFNPKLEGDDNRFIDKAALEVVSMKLNERRLPQERLIGPPLTEVKTKEEYVFFKAIYQGVDRMYAIDKTHKNLIQRVIIDTNNLQKSIGIFFDGWYPRTSKSLQLTVYKDRKINISISDQEPTVLFVEKIVAYQLELFKETMRKHDNELSRVDNSISTIMKELFIPFYSCVKSMGEDDAGNAFTSCLLDGIFLVIPAGKKAVSTAFKLNERFIDISFMIKKNQSFRKDGSILWGKIINDFHIYNIILNEQAILRTSVVDLLLGSLDPGIGLIKEIRGIAKITAMTLLRGGLIRLPLTSLKHFKSIAEFSIKAKSIVDLSKKIAVKVSRPSGRLSSRYHHLENETDSFPSLYGSAYQFGDYYAYYSNRREVDMILAITDEVTAEEENIYVTLSEDEFNGVIFRCACKETELSLCQMTPIATAESNAIKIISSDTHSHISDREITFKPEIPNQFDNLVFYPKYQILLFEDGIAKNKFYTIFKIGEVHYLFDPDKKQLRLLYDGDEVEVKKRYQGDDNYHLNRDNKGGVVVRRERPANDSTMSAFNVEYALGGFFPPTGNGIVKNKMTLSFISGRLLLSYRGRYFNLEVTTLRNQFSIADIRHLFPSFIVGWHSLENNFSPAKPYLKKSSPHVGMMLEDILDENCGYDEKLKKFPTLLLNGAISAQFNIKLRVLNMHYPLGQPVNGLFPLECRGFRLPMFFWLFYDLFTESFELASSQQSLTPPQNYTLSPYDKLLSRLFPVEKFPDMAEIINLNDNQYSDKITMRLRQAAFLQRLNPVDRLDTLQLPLAQIYSWELHPDVQSFQKKYPAAALWMTWQRQLHRLVKSKFSHELPLLKRAHLPHDENHPYTSGLFINSQYSYHDAIWESDDETKKTIIFHDTEKQFYSEALNPEDDEVEWVPKVKYANPFPVTQFMYEKNVLPKISVNKESNHASIQDCYLGKVYLERYTTSTKIEYFIISANGEWLASIDSERHILIYNLHEKNILYTKGKESIIYAKRYSKLDEYVAENYGLLSLSDTGVLYYPKDNLWTENSGDDVLWSPPINYFPAFISPDQRFLGFKHQNKIDVIIYDQKRKLMVLLKCPLSQSDHVNITAVAFSALNAVVSLAFDDGHVYLYDLIREKKDTLLNPIAHIKLNNIINNKPYNNILMRFDGVFDTLTIIHPVGLFIPYHQEKDVIYVRSSYGFHG